MTLIMLLSVVSIPVLASDNSEIQPRYTYISGIAADITINTSLGTANCYGLIQARNKSVMLVCQLQQRENGQWKTIKSWSASGQDRVLLRNNYAVASGYTYRVLVNGYVYDSDYIIIERTLVEKIADY